MPCWLVPAQADGSIVMREKASEGLVDDGDDSIAAPTVAIGTRLLRCTRAVAISELFVCTCACSF
jgi:hypothetical protein